MVVRSAQKGRDDIQRIRDAMESRKPVITDHQRELIVKQANVIGEDGEAMIQDIENAALETNQMAADVFKLIESCMASLSQKVRIQMQSDEVIRQKAAGETEANRGHKGAGNNASRQPTQRRQAQRGVRREDDEEVSE
jgi:hypothetical protein